MLRTERSQGRRRRSGIGSNQARAMPREPTNARKSRVTQSENENALALPFMGHLLYRAYRSFNVESPNNTSIIVMIQNRTTTWFSFQPFSS